MLRPPENSPKYMRFPSLTGPLVFGSPSFVICFAPTIFGNELLILDQKINVPPIASVARPNVNGTNSLTRCDVSFLGSIGTENDGLIVPVVSCWLAGRVSTGATNR